MDGILDGLKSVFSNLAKWAASPFSTQMSLTYWFLFTGLIICLVIAWMMILRELKGVL